MSIIRRMRKQVAVWWERSSIPDHYGRYSFSEPVEIDCRWDERAEQYRNAIGQECVSRAVVYVDREMKTGDRLQQAGLESDTPADPRALTDAFEIQQFAVTPNLKAREFLYTAYL